MRVVDETQPAATLGLSIPNRAILLGQSLDELIDLALEADRSPAFGSVWTGDNFVSKPRFEAMILLSAIAARTTRVRLGTACMATFPLRHPLEFAIQWASLDVLSRGRTILVPCIGGAASWGPEYAAELKAFGVRSVDRVDRLEEGIELLRLFWQDGPVNHQSEFYEFEDIRAFPKPFQDRVPIVIAVNPPEDKQKIVERALRRVARLADGWQTAVVPPDLLRERWARIREFADEYNRAERLTHLSLHLMLNINADPERAAKNLRSFLLGYYGEDHMMNEEQLSYFTIAGPPEMIAERLTEFIDAGCTDPIVRFADSSPLEQLSRFNDEVVPLLGSKIRMVSS